MDEEAVDLIDELDREAELDPELERAGAPLVRLAEEEAEFEELIRGEDCDERIEEVVGRTDPNEETEDDLADEDVRRLEELCDRVEGTL